MDEAPRELHRETGLAAAAYSPRANGFFGGKSGRGRWRVASPSARHVRRVYSGGASSGRLERVREVAARLGRSPNQVALAALMEGPFPVFPIVGAHPPQQLEDSAGAGDPVLNADLARSVKTGS